MQHIRVNRHSNMNLFPFQPNLSNNILPKDGIVNYYGKLLSTPEANRYFDCLLKTIVWNNDQVIIYGRRIVTKRKVAWYGDSDFEYTYSNSTKYALPWTTALSELKLLAEERSNETFNSCLLNLYHTGEEGMAWHSDDEKELTKNGAIGSFSFGAERTFSFKHKETRETVKLHLEHGSLLVMKGTTQSNWLHRLPPTRAITEPRINLTFRSIAV